MLLHADSSCPLCPAIDGHHAPRSNFLDSALDFDQERSVGPDAYRLPRNSHLGTHCSTGQNIAVSDLLPQPFVQQRRWWINQGTRRRQKLTGDLGSTHAATPGHLHRRRSPLQPGIEVLDPLVKVETNPHHDRSWPRTLAKNTPELSALHLDVVRPLDPRPQGRTEPLEGVGSRQPHEDRDQYGRHLRVNSDEKRYPKTHSAGGFPMFSATALPRGLGVGDHHGEVGGAGLRQNAEVIVRGGKLVVGFQERNVPEPRPLLDRPALPVIECLGLSPYANATR